MPFLGLLGPLEPALFVSNTIEITNNTCLPIAVQYSIVLYWWYGTVWNSTVLYGTVQYSSVQYSTLQALVDTLVKKWINSKTASS